MSCLRYCKSWWKKYKVGTHVHRATRQRFFDSLSSGSWLPEFNLHFESLEPRRMLAVSPAPDLTATKTNNVGGEVNPGQSWTWNIRVANEGDAAANFSVESTVLIDNLPDTDITYGAVTVTPNTTNVSCFIDSGSNLYCYTNSGSFNFAADGFFDVSFTATPSAITTYVNPRAGVGEMCRTDPNDEFDELDDTNNDCFDSVTVVSRDLTVTKTNNEGGAILLGDDWTWNLNVQNSGVTAATFAPGETVLIDNLPQSDINYDAPTVSPITTNVNCSIDANQNLTCTAGTGGLSITSLNSFDVSFVAKPTKVGTFKNPRVGGVDGCEVDPDDNSLETNEANNTCSDSVKVVAPELTVTKTNNVSSLTTLGNDWIWNLHVANGGNSQFTFSPGDTVLVDNLPDSDINYSTVTVSPNTTNISCSINATQDLTCVAGAGGLTILSGGAFDVSFTATPTTAKFYANPRPGGGNTCEVDPDANATESNETNNTCSDSVAVTAPDMFADKSNNVGGTTTLGNSWIWKFQIGNGGIDDASFAAGDTVLIDNLPDSNINYGSVTVTPNTTNVNCSIDGSKNLTCTAGAGGLYMISSSAFDVSFTATPTATGTFDNPRSGRATRCTVDPDDHIIESAEFNNDCSDSVVVTAPDLTATKTNNVSNATTLGNSWTWNVRVANSGNGAASFLQGATVLLDNLPDTNVNYGGVSVSPNTTNVSCSIDGSKNLSCTAGSGGLSVPVSSFFDVFFTATPAAVGTFINPRTGGTNKCQVDPNSGVTESNESNNTCSNTVTVTAPDLTATKSNNVSSATTLGNNWTWNLRLANAGNAAASFAQGATVLLDNLPDSNVNYGAVSVSPNTTNVSCSIDGSKNLSCTAGSGGLSVPASSFFDVTFIATPTAIGTYSNPRSGGSNQCKVDPNSGVTESNESNNTCSDSVTVTASDLTVSKTNDVGGSTTLGNSWTWNLRVANGGNAAASFAQGASVLLDNLPDANVNYSAVSVSPISTNVSCAIDGSQNLNCTAGTGGLSVPASSFFDVFFTVTPTAGGTYINPRSGGANQCTVDPSLGIAESNENNNSCSDSVSVATGDLTVTKSNDVSGEVTLGDAWTWNLQIANVGSTAITFAPGATVLLDNLPDTSIAYSSVVVSPITTNVSCSIDGSQNLSCVAGAGGLAIAPSTSFDVSFLATATALGTYTNPRSGGANVCQVDPNNVAAESNENNNSCTDSVNVVVCGPYITNTTLSTGRNRIRVINGTPGNIIAFYLGSQNGQYYVRRYGVTIDIADPTKVAQAVVASNGMAIAYIYIPLSLRGHTLLLQGFEKFYPKCVTNLVTATVPLMAEGGEGTGAVALSPADLPAIVEQAKQRWQDEGLSDEQLQRLEDAEIELIDLPAGQLGAVAGSTVYVDVTGAGYGWYVDSHPEDEAEFTVSGGELQAADSETASRMDLLTVIMHELGHVLGLTHSDDADHDLLSDALAAGERRLPTAELADEADMFDIDEALADLTGEAGYVMDVNEDGWVSPLDGLAIINELTRSGSRPLGGSTEFETLDVNGDGWITPLDALQVINDLNANGGRVIPQPDLISPLLASANNLLNGTEGEGEASTGTEIVPAAPFYPALPATTSVDTTTSQRRSAVADTCDDELLDLIAADSGRDELLP